MTADGPLRREKICHGKQILSFAEDGALEKIEKNSQADSQNPSAFNGEDQYFIKDGNIYIQEGRSGRENCVVGNGHIVWMDCRCQSLWYVCSYQIPNSDQIKMTAFRSELDGDSEEELITDSPLLKKEGLQFSKDWIIIKVGILFLERVWTAFGRRRWLRLTESILPSEIQYFIWMETM